MTLGGWEVYLTFISISTRATPRPSGQLLSKQSVAAKVYLFPKEFPKLKIQLTEDNISSGQLLGRPNVALIRPPPTPTTPFICIFQTLGF